MEKRQIWFLFQKERSSGFLFRVEATINGNSIKGASTTNRNRRKGVSATSKNGRKGASVANGIETTKVS